MDTSDIHLLFLDLYICHRSDVDCHCRMYVRILGISTYYYLLPIILSSVLPFARSSTSLSRMRRSFIRGSSISSILIPQILPFTPHCSYISANTLISRIRFLDIRILGPHKFSCLYWNMVHLRRVVYL